MVADYLTHASLYRGLGPRFAEAFDYIARTNFAAMAPGKHLIDGENMYVSLVEYETKRPEDCRWEAHRRYIDVQVMVKGSERIGVGNVDTFKVEPYDPALDVYWMDGDGDFLTFAEGTFMIFWPQDAHLPGLRLQEPAKVLKAVVKIAIPE